MSYLTERLSDLQHHLSHLQELRAQVRAPKDLRHDLSLDNDVRHSLLVSSQRVIDIAAELSSRRRLRFEDYSEAVRNLAIYEEFPDALIRRIEHLPELRDTLIHGNGPVDPARIVSALQEIDGLERFVAAVEKLASKKR